VSDRLGDSPDIVDFLEISNLVSFEWLKCCGWILINCPDPEIRDMEYISKQIGHQSILSGSFELFSLFCRTKSHRFKDFLSENGSHLPTQEGWLGFPKLVQCNLNCTVSAASVDRVLVGCTAWLAQKSGAGR